MRSKDGEGEDAYRSCFRKNSSTCSGSAAQLPDRCRVCRRRAIEGGVQGFGQGTDIAARLGDTVAGALSLGSGLRTGRWWLRSGGQPAGAGRPGPARHDADGIRTGVPARQRVKELVAQPEVGEFQGGVLVIHPVHGVGRLAGLGAEQGTDLCLPCPRWRGFQRPPQTMLRRTPPL